MISYLRHEFSFNASHSSFGAGAGSHHHTFLVTCFFECYGNSEEERRAVEMNAESWIGAFIKGFDGQFLDDLVYFGGAYPSVELMGDMFFETIRAELKKKNAILCELDISDSPTTYYQVSDRIMLTNLNDNISVKNYDMLMRLMERI